MPPLKGTQRGVIVLYTMFLVSSSINVSIFHSTWLDTFWTDLVLPAGDTEVWLSFQNVNVLIHIFSGVCKNGNIPVLSFFLHISWDLSVKGNFP